MKNENSRKPLLVGTTNSDFSGYVLCDKRKRDIGRWMVFNKTMKDIYQDIYDEAVEQSKDDIFGYIGIINILDSGNHGRRVIYDYASTPDNDIIDSLRPHLITVREHCVDIWVYMREYAVTPTGRGALVNDIFEAYVNTYRNSREE